MQFDEIWQMLQLKLIPPIGKVASERNVNTAFVVDVCLFEEIHESQDGVFIVTFVLFQLFAHLGQVTAQLELVAIVEMNQIICFTFQQIQMIGHFFTEITERLFEYFRH